MALTTEGRAAKAQIDGHDDATCEEHAQDWARTLGDFLRDNKAVKKTQWHLKAYNPVEPERPPDLWNTQWGS